MTSDLQVSDDAVVLWSFQAAGGRSRQLRRSTHHQVTERRVAEAIRAVVLEVLESLEGLGGREGLEGLEGLEPSYWKKNCRKRDKSYVTEDL